MLLGDPQPPSPTGDSGQVQSGGVSLRGLPLLRQEPGGGHVAAVPQLHAAASTHLCLTKAKWLLWLHQDGKMTHKNHHHHPQKETKISWKEKNSGHNEVSRPEIINTIRSVEAIELSVLLLWHLSIWYCFPLSNHSCCP